MEILLMSYLAGAKSITKKYLSKMVSNKIIFIPTAGNVEPYTGYIDEGVEMLKSLGYVEYNQIMDDKSIASELDDYMGVNVFNHYVLPHIGEYPFEETAQKTLDTYQDKIPLVPINNNEVILVEDHGYTVLTEKK